MAVIHQPVLTAELLESLDLKSGGVYVDGTLGTGGHALALLQKAGPNCLLIGIDRDSEALAIAKERLKSFERQTKIFQANFFEAGAVIQKAGVKKVDGITVDLGLSSYQLETAQRGFSFLREGPLDMRMSLAEGESALEKIKGSSEIELADVLEKFGEERLAKKIARSLIEAVKKGAIQTTLDLAELVKKIYPPKARFGRIHPATRTFQALRIWVNGELENLKKFLAVAPGLLNPDGRLCVIAYHSLEDRIVKQSFRNLCQAEESDFEVLTKRPRVPSEEEIAQNPRSRSAKLRVLRRQ